MKCAPSAPTLTIAQSRKLRHLQAISIRNVTITAQARRRGQSVDDDKAPHALRTRDKLAVVPESESRFLHPSRSASDLTGAGAGSGDRRHGPDQGDPDPQHNNHALQSEHQKCNTRRRSTPSWSGPSPDLRQTQLERVADERLTDTWFSLHTAGVSSPVYVSEVVSRGINPDFQALDLTSAGPRVSRRDDVTVRCWARAGGMEDYVLFLELNLCLRSLQHIGRSLDGFHAPFPANTLVFTFSDGIYANLTDLPPMERQPQTFLASQQRTPPPPSPPPPGAVPTSSYEALMRLATLDDCIQDALATRAQLEAAMNRLLLQQRPRFSAVEQRAQAAERLADVRRATGAARRQLRQAEQRRSEIWASLGERRMSMARGRDRQEQIDGEVKEVTTTAVAPALRRGAVTVSLGQGQQHARYSSGDEAAETAGQARRICEDVQQIYPVEPVPRRPLAFTIRGLTLPSGPALEDADDKDGVAAALGYTAHAVQLLAFYMATPLVYPLHPRLSTSSVSDPISLGLPTRTFPLYPVNPLYRFEYGVFLLNKNIENLALRIGLRGLDIRQTLPNLKYVLYLLTARAGDAPPPARKVGGFVRGLLDGGGGRRTPASLSRRGSDDSVRSTATSAGGSAHAMAGSGVGFGSRRLHELLLEANLPNGSSAAVRADRQPGRDGREGLQHALTLGSS